MLDRTPFYAESGGQVGDKGYLVWDGGRMEVQDTRRPVGGIIVHRGVVLEGTLEERSGSGAVVPGSVRWDTMRNHTATHLVHKALRDVLGTHVHQAGSVVEPGRLRFDFHHSQPLTHDELTRDRAHRQRADTRRLSGSHPRDGLPDRPVKKAQWPSSARSTVL